MPSNDRIDPEPVRDVNIRRGTTQPERDHLVHRAELLPAHPLRRAIIGELDEELDAELDLANTRAPPLKAIVH